jgi:hypothetical protein
MIPRGIAAHYTNMRLPCAIHTLPKQLYMQVYVSMLMTVGISSKQASMATVSASCNYSIARAD